jgi:outer membrane protein assembly factor BamA
LFKGPHDKSVTSLYMDKGYLFFYTEISEKMVDGKVELTANISEGEQVWINDVIVREKGAGKSLARQVRTLLDVRKGQLFNRSLLLTSQEKVAKSGLVNPDSVTINPYPLPNPLPDGRRYVDIEFIVQEP